MALIFRGEKREARNERRTSLRHCFALIAILLCLFTGAAKSQEAPPSPLASRLSPLFWADGITRAGELDAYKAQGFNVVVVRLSWRASPNGEISAFDLAPQRAFAEEAARRGLKVIYALPAAPTGLETPFRLSANSGAYVSLWTAWLQGAVASLRDTPNLIGWMLPDDPRALPYFDDAGFQSWISQNYADVGVVNRQWKARFESLDDLSISGVNQLISNWSGEAPLTEKERQSSVVTRRQTEEGWAFHPAALALAHYKWDAYRALVTTWVGALRGEDKTHLVLSGRTPDYAQLLSLPAGIDVAVPDLAPDAGENDIVTHNPQAIDIARRGGKFGVLPVISPRVSADLPASALPD
ncbi:MAG: hypothetical protein KY445_16990, partial [Armatimonadetes bacterium]|nr:hypothetical protein [Armatimonadota bacterium]